jgi:hypothetical protein
MASIKVPCTVRVVVSEQKLKELLDTLTDAPAGEEFSESLDTIDGRITVTRSNADPGLYWLTVAYDPDDE